MSKDRVHTVDAQRATMDAQDAPSELSAAIQRAENRLAAYPVYEVYISPADMRLLVNAAASLIRCQQIVARIFADGAPRQDAPPDAPGMSKSTPPKENP